VAAVQVAKFMDQSSVLRLPRIGGAQQDIVPNGYLHVVRSYCCPLVDAIVHQYGFGSSISRTGRRGGV